MKTTLPGNFAKAKILCTLGPVTNNADIIKKMILQGMDGVRLNFSHGDYNFIKKSINPVLMKTPLFQF